MLVPASRATPPRMTSTKASMAPYTTSTSLPSGMRLCTPNLLTVTPIRAKTPMGASFMIWLVTQNMVSATS